MILFNRQSILYYYFQNNFFIYIENKLLLLSKFLLLYSAVARSRLLGEGHFCQNF